MRSEVGRAHQHVLHQRQLLHAWPHFRWPCTPMKKRSYDDVCPVGQRAISFLFVSISASVVVVFAMLSFQVGHCNLAGHVQPHPVTVVRAFCTHPQYIFGMWAQ